MDQQIQDAILSELRALVRTIAPDATLRPMYGGTVIELEKDVPKSRIGGFFGYENHVSVEFGNGADFDDPKGLLEGSGKHRRHVKLRTLSDIADKDCAGFLRRAIGGA